MQGLLLLLVRGLPLLATEVGSRHVGITPVALGTAWDQIGRKQQQIPTDARRSRHVAPPGAPALWAGVSRRVEVHGNSAC